MKLPVWSTLVLGLWLMISPFLLAFVNRRVLGVLWEDLLLGFGIATFSLCRLVSHRRGPIVFADWLIVTLGLLTLINPFLYSYANAPLGRWNNWIIGGVIFILALYQDRKDETMPSNSYANEAKTGSEELIGSTGVTHETLAPEGYIKIHGELWKAQTSGRPIPRDRAVKVTGARGMTLIVEADDDRGSLDQ